MCFSATASFTASGVLAAIGFLSMRAAPSKDLRLIAVIPLVFALQQLLEGIVWINLGETHTHSLMPVIAMHGFLFFAGIFWPIWIPWILYRLEQNPSRKKIIQVNLWGGIVIAVFCVFLITTIGHHAEIVAHHIAYPLQAGTLEPFFTSYGKMGGYFCLIGLYLLVTAGSCFISTVRYMWVFGLLVSIGFIIAQIFYAYAFGSVWCYFAAIISISCYFIVKNQRA